MSNSGQTYGIKIAQPGLDANKCADWQLIFNSSWPCIAIVLNKTITVTTDSNGSFTFDHNLGFYPLVMAWRMNNGGTLGRIFPSVSTSQAIFDSTSSPGSGYFPANTQVTLNIKCYNLDITGQQSYTYLQSSSTVLPYDPTYGIKVVKQGKDINSNDLRDFILHSRAASPMVLTVLTEQSAVNNVISYTNPQGYTPWAFGYAGWTHTSGRQVYSWAPPYQQAYPAINFSNARVSLTLASGSANPYGWSANGKGSIILLRDPLFAPQDVQVTY